MKRVICFVMALFLALCSLGACNSAEAAKETSTGNVTLRWWAFPTFAQENTGDSAGKYERKLISAFEKDNPGIKIQLTMLDFTTGPEKLSHALQNGNECDLLFDAPGRIIEYGKEGYLADLNDMFTDSFVEDVGNDTVLQSCKAGDTAYMYPLSSAPFYMAFNKSMLEDAGVLDKVKEGWTVDDFTEVLEALSAKGYVAGSVFCKDQGGDQATRALVANLFDSSVTDSELSEYTIADDAGKKAIRYIKEMADKGLLVNGTYLNGSDDIFNFVNGRSSFTLLWGPNQQNSNEKVLKDNNISVVEVPFPSEDGKAELEYLVNGFCVMNNCDEAKIAAAKKFISFLCDDETYGPENVIRTGCIPVRSSFGSLYKEERMEVIMAWTEDYGTYYNTVDGFSEMRTQWAYMLRDMLGGYSPPEKALSVFAEKANATLDTTRKNELSVISG